VAALFTLSASLPSQTRQQFEVAGHSAFLILPDQVKGARSIPWVWYAPNLRGLPGKAEKWLFDRFLAAGIAIAGVNVGESYGSPAGRRVFRELHRHVVKEHALATKPCLLARSRGGLMLYNWAAENAAHVSGIAGIYPVCNLVSYPGLAKASGAYGLTEVELQKALPLHNPIERLKPLADAGVPIFHLHGDRDKVVPAADNSELVRKRYKALGGEMVLKTAVGQGHNMWRGFFESQDMVDFVVRCARTTRGLVDLATPAPRGAVHYITDKGASLVPEKADVASKWQFADGVLTASPAWDSVVTKESYRDFVMHVEFNVNESSGDDPETRGNSGIYIQQRYEVQILDSFGVAAKDYKNSFCGSLYRLKKPDQLVCKKPGEWQSYDIAFRAAVFVDKKKVRDARITVYHNGELIHDDVAVSRKTGAGQREAGSPGPIKLQGHHNPVRFRNFWVLPLSR